MSAHVSVRLFWHDNGWDGAICRDPAGNVWCEAHEHVRDNKPLADEVEKKGRPVDEAGVAPGCEMSIQAFARRGNQIRVWPPDWMSSQGVNPKDIKVGAMSGPLWPYEDMWTEDGGYKPNDERRAIAESFIREIELHKSLAFFYVDERNPLFVDDGERSPHRLLVGISRIKEIGEIDEWDEPTRNGEVNMIWSVPFKHAYPDDGIRLPVQAIAQRVSDPAMRRRYAVALDGGLRTDFRYGSARISHDRAVAVTERAIAALGALETDRVLDTSVSAQLEWLNSLLLELWEERGPYPGLGVVLLALGCARGVEIAHTVAPALLEAGEDAAGVVLAALNGEVHQLLAPFAAELEEAGDEWEYLSEDDRRLVELLVRLDLTRDQAEHLLSATSREKHRLPADAGAILANPYVLCERYVPLKDGESISFLTVDHGLLPHESITAPFERVPRRDPRRLRALLVEFLRERAESGDTFASATAAVEAAAERSPADRRCDVGVDRLEHEKVAPVLDELIERFELDGVQYLALRSVRDDETLIEAVLRDVAARPLIEDPAIDWQEIADGLADRDGGARVELSDEQQEALNRSYRSPLSVLTGAAGTGKSTLLAPLVAAIEEKEGRVPIRALTPTGKAADRLKDVGVQATTIHRALAGADWYDWSLGRWHEDSDGRVGADTLIIDESSMVDVTLLGTLFRAIDWHSVQRLLFVGDHHQIPPIGPGRPFFDLIAQMQRDDRADESGPFASRLNELTHNYRVAEGSRAIALASGFAGHPEADDPLIWVSLAKGEDQGDLRVRFWETPEELHELVLEELGQLAERECERELPDLDERKRFDATLGHYKSPFDALHWQIIAPLKDPPHGTRKLNAVIQDHFHGWAKRAKRAPNGAILRWPVKFGNEQITALDKVMQISNERLPGYDLEKKSKDKFPVFNGQIGTVRGEYPPAMHKFRKGQKGPVELIKVAFEGYDNLRFDYTKSGYRSVDRHLELAYAVTVHKSQGSQFRHVFFVVPAAAADVFGRELTYTGLTRAQDSLTLLIERDVNALLSLRRRAAARTPQRNSRLFRTSPGNLPYHAENLVQVTTRGDYVRSKSELIIANLLHRYELEGKLTYEYEEELHAPGGDDWDFRLPDFTVHAGGKTFYWEHCGMTDNPAYVQRWEEVRRPWYVRNGFSEQLITTYDGEAKNIDSPHLENDVIRGQILGIS